MMVRPRFCTGANTPDRVPTTTRACPFRMRRHCCALGIVKSRVEDRDLVAEAMEELAGDSRSQGNLGYQEQRIAAL